MLELEIDVDEPQVNLSPEEFKIEEISRRKFLRSTNVETNVEKSDKQEELKSMVFIELSESDSTSHTRPKATSVSPVPEVSLISIDSNSPTPLK